MLTLVVVAKALLEVADLALLGQGVLYVLAGARRERNVFYRVLRTVTAPAMRLTRLITPRFVADEHIGLGAFFLVLGLWFALVLFKARLLYDAGVTTVIR